MSSPGLNVFKFELYIPPKPFSSKTRLHEGSFPSSDRDEETSHNYQNKKMPTHWLNKNSLDFQDQNMTLRNKKSESVPINDHLSCLFFNKSNEDKINICNLNFQSTPVCDENLSLKEKLRISVQKGNLEEIKEFLIKNDINGIYDDGNTLLHISILYYKFDVFNFIFQKINKSYLKHYNRSGFLPIHIAINSGNLYVIKFLLRDYRGSLDSLTTFGIEKLSLLQLSVQFQYCEVVDYLIANGSNINVITNKDQTILHLSCIGGDKEIIETILSECPEEYLILKDKNGLIPLHNLLLSNKSNLQAVELLYDKTVDFIHKNYQNDFDFIVSQTKNTLLHLACFDGNYQVVKFIFEKDMTSINKFNSSGYTPLHIACENNQYEIVDLLTSLESDIVNIKTDDNLKQSPLHLSYRNKNFDIFKLLLDKGGDVYIENSKGKTCLHYAAIKDDVEIFSYLLDYQIDICKKSSIINKSPLDYIEVVKRNEINIKWINYIKNIFKMYVELGQEKDLLFFLNIFIKILNMENVIIYHGKSEEKYSFKIFKNNDINKINIQNESYKEDCLRFFEEIKQDFLELFSMAVIKGYDNFILKFVNHDEFNFSTAKHVHKNILKRFETICNMPENKSVIIFVDIAVKLMKLVELETNFMHIAAKNSRSDFFSVFISHSVVNNDIKNFNEIIDSDKNIAKILIEKMDNRGYTVFHHLISERDINSLNILDKKINFNYKVSTKYNEENPAIFKGETIFHLACKIKNEHDFQKSNEVLNYIFSFLKRKKVKIDMIKLLIDKRIKHSKEAPIHYATKYLNNENFKLLIHNKADKKIQLKYNNYSLLNLSSIVGNNYVVKYFFDKKKWNLFSEKGNDGKTPLHLSSEKGYIDIVKILTNKEIIYDLELEELDFDNEVFLDNNGKTPFHLACENGHVNTVEYFLELIKNGRLKFDCNKSKDKDGNTPIDLAFINGRKKVYELLLQPGYEVFDERIKILNKENVYLQQLERYANDCFDIFDKKITISNEINNNTIISNLMSSFYQWVITRREKFEYLKNKNKLIEDDFSKLYSIRRGFDFDSKIPEIKKTYFDFLIKVDIYKIAEVFANFEDEESLKINKYFCQYEPDHEEHLDKLSLFLTLYSNREVSSQ